MMMPIAPPIMPPPEAPLMLPIIPLIAPRKSHAQIAMMMPRKK